MAKNKARTYRNLLEGFLTSELDRIEADRHTKVRKSRTQATEAKQRLREALLNVQAVDERHEHQLEHERIRIAHEHLRLKREQLEVESQKLAVLGKQHHLDFEKRKLDTVIKFLEEGNLSSALLMAHLDDKDIAMKALELYEARQQHRMPEEDLRRREEDLREREAALKKLKDAEAARRLRKERMNEARQYTRSHAEESAAIRDLVDDDDLADDLMQKDFEYSQRIIEEIMGETDGEAPFTS